MLLYYYNYFPMTIDLQELSTVSGEKFVIAVFGLNALSG
jgi:hypothetical protein